MENIASKFFENKLHDPKFSKLTEDEREAIISMGKACYETHEILMEISFLQGLIVIIKRRLKGA